MMNAVDKYSTDNIADNEMIIAVDDVVKKDYDSAVVRIKKALARLKSQSRLGPLEFCEVIISIWSPFLMT